jgi:transcriptional regulator with XRE-family HTH domain
MTTNPGALLVLIQDALGLTQQELGDLIGRSKRTIQRWQSMGTRLLARDSCPGYLSRPP